MTMGAKKDGKKLRAGERATGGKLKEVRRNCGEGIGKRPNTRASISARQTKATSKESVERLDGATGSLEVVKQVTEDGKPGRARRVKLVEEPLKDVDDNESGLREQSRTRRACTRSGGRNGLITVASGNENLEMRENCLPSVAVWHWTEQQKKAFAESLATTKPGANFWRRIAEQVPERSAEECFKKFYSGRTTTRAAKCSRRGEADFALIERKWPTCLGFLQSSTLMNAKTIGRERKTARQAGAKGLVKEVSKICVKGRNAGATSRKTTRQSTKRRIGGASTSPDIEQVPPKKQDNFQKAIHNLKVSERATKGSKNRTGKQDLIKKSEIHVGSTLDVALPSGFDQASVLEDGDREIQCASDSINGDRWTTAQEAALQDAYATIKLSANFWHLISKQVPGRSEEECFNKFYSSHPTPPRAVAAQRSCLKEVNFQPSLPNHRQPPKAKRLLEAHKIVRNILRRQQVDDEDYEADAFAALEPPDVVYSVMEKATDDGVTTSNETDTKISVRGSLPGSTENSTTQFLQSDKENRKPKMVREQQRDFGIIAHSQVVSPEILKKVKDPLMLDKYIDHWHQRRTRRPGTNSAQRNTKRASGAEHYAKDGLDFREFRLDAIHRAKQELRDVFLRPGSAVDDPFLDLLTDSTNDGEGDEEDVESVESQMDS